MALLGKYGDLTQLTIRAGLRIHLINEAGYHADALHDAPGPVSGAARGFPEDILTSGAANGASWA
jgi:hypothetical protein